MRRMLSGSIAVILLSLAMPAGAAAARSWSLSTAEEFSKGRLDGTALDAEGRIVLAPATETVWGPAEGIVWDVAPDGHGGAFAAVSSPTRVVHLQPGREPEFWHATGDETLVAAILPDDAGGLYMGLSPDGRVLHATAPGDVRELADTQSLFVWALAGGSDGAVWVGTGLPGRLLRLDPDGKTEAVFESGDDPVRCIAALPGGGVVFGTGGRGRVVRIAAPGRRPFVLFDADESEIVAVETAADGTVFALAARGTKQITAGQAAPEAQATVRVTATAPPGGDEEDDDGEDQPEPETSRRVRPRFKTPAGGVLYRIGTDGDFRVLWRSADEIPFAMTRRDDGSLLVATGDAGRIYSVTEEGRAQVLVQLASDQASAIATAADGSLLAGGTTDARVERIAAGPAARGEFLSPVHDAGGLAGWGRLTWEGSVPPGSKLRAEVRAGNTAIPDPTWSGWQRLHGGSGEGVRTELPATRWFQTRLVLEPSKGGASPSLRRVELFYQPHNRRPVIDELTVEPAGVVWSRTAIPSSSPSGPPVAADPVTRRTLADLRPASSRPVRKSFQLGARTISWRAEDPDGDELTFRLDIRREERSAWIPLAVDVDGDFHTWDARELPDGLYRARLVASDRGDNPEGKALEDERVSAAFLIDNTRPTFGAPDIKRVQRGYEVEFTAIDRDGNVVAAEVAVDSAEWQPLQPIDGVADEPEERYRVTIEQTPSGKDDGPRTVRVRVTDSAGNMAGDAWSLTEPN